MVNGTNLLNENSALSMCVTILGLMSSQTLIKQFCALEPISSFALEENLDHLLQPSDFIGEKIAF